jgi:hypothetical protein
VLDVGRSRAAHLALRRHRGDLLFRLLDRLLDRLQATFLRIEHGAVDQLGQRGRKALRNDKFVLVTAPAEIRAAREAWIDALAGDLFDVLPIVAGIELHARLLAAQAHRQIAAVLLQ